MQIQLLHLLEHVLHSLIWIFPATANCTIGWYSYLSLTFSRHLQDILRGCKLRYLNISHCDKFTYEIFGFLATCTSIEELHMIDIGTQSSAWMKKFDEFSLCCSSLTTLRLSYISISSQAITMIARR